jgi:hypothetical protein
MKVTAVRLAAILRAVGDREIGLTAVTRND